MAQVGDRKKNGNNSEDPGKLVAEDVILVAKSEHELQKLLDACIHGP